MQHTTSYIFSAIFVVTGVLNLVLVHPVPGAFYLLLSLLYLPWTDKFIERRLGYSISPVVKVVFGLIILWGTLAVGDLAEILGL